MAFGNRKITIALDAMGGDHGASIILDGALKALIRHGEIHYLIFGKEDTIGPLLASRPQISQHSTFYPCDVSISMDERPSQALRRGRKDSSMWRAIAAVRDGSADAVISAGNTGALMAMAKVCLKMITGIDRPALATTWPNLKGESIVLDVGAGIGANAEQLVGFALMGCQMSRVLYGLDRPKVGLLNVGVEEMKGLEEIREAGVRLKEINFPTMDYVGFAEGGDMGKGDLDVIVSEGFSGNIALKTAEGTASQIGIYLRNTLSRTFLSRLGAILASSAFSHLREKMDTRKLNGAVFLGVNGVVVKSHGGADATGFAAAVSVAYNNVQNSLLERTAKEISIIQKHSSPNKKSDKNS